MSVSEENLNKIIIALVSGASNEMAEQICVSKLGLKLKDAKSAIIDARKQITVAADFNRVDELGTAIIRLQDVYAKSMRVQDTKTALAAQKELNKLLDLYRAVEHAQSMGGDLEAVSIAEQELAAIAQHLLPLNLAKKDYPLSGHARIVAEKLRRLQSEATAKDG